jgi:hypothetical protein
MRRAPVRDRRYDLRVSKSVWCGKKRSDGGETVINGEEKRSKMIAGRVRLWRMTVTVVELVDRRERFKSGYYRGRATLKQADGAR